MTSMARNRGTFRLKMRMFFGVLAAVGALIAIRQGPAPSSVSAGENPPMDGPLDSARHIDPGEFQPNFDETLFEDLPVAILHGGLEGEEPNHYTFDICHDTRFFADIDRTAPDLDTTLSLFNESGTLIGFADNSPVDLGSLTRRDPFLGVMTLRPGRYVLTVAKASTPPAALTAERIENAQPLVRPDAESGGYRILDAETGNHSFLPPPVQRGEGTDESGDPYRLGISVEQPCDPFDYNFRAAGEAGRTGSAGAFGSADDDPRTSAGPGWTLPSSGGGGGGSGGGGAPGGDSPFDPPDPDGGGDGGDPRPGPAVVPSPLAAPLALAALALLGGRRHRDETSFS